jgi:hypothetical protein
MRVEVRIPIAHSRFGLDAAAELQQIITETMHGAPHRVTPQHRGTTGVVHIDNVLVGGTKQQCEHARDVCTTNAAAMGITLNDDMAITTTPEFCGMAFDLNNQTLRIRPATVARWNRDPVFAGNLEDLTFEQWERVLGRLFHGAAILDLDLTTVPRYFAIKVWRRQLAKLARREALWQAKWSPTTRCINALRALRDEVLANKARPIPDKSAPGKPATTTATVFVDATLEGYGGVVVASGCPPHGFGGKFGQTMPSMGLAETAGVLAGLHAAERFVPKTVPVKVRLRIDNTTALRATGAKTSKTTDIDAVMRRIRAFKDAHPHWQIEASWVASAKNPGDGSTARGFPTTHQTCSGANHPPSSGGVGLHQTSLCEGVDLQWAAASTAHKN